MRKLDNPHSRFVRIAKITLPLLALALLSTLFLFNRSIDPADAIPFANVDIRQIAKDQVLNMPRFSAVTDDGTEVVVTAERATPDQDGNNQLSAANINADLRTPAGVEYRIFAPTGLYDGQAARLDLTGNVDIETSDGYKLKASGVSADLSETGLTTTGAITGTAPAGEIEAGEMVLSREDGTQVLVFKKGVRLIYRPKNE